MNNKTVTINTLDGSEVIVNTSDIIFLSKNKHDTHFVHLPNDSLYKINEEEYKRIKKICFEED